MDISRSALPPLNRWLFTDHYKFTQNGVTYKIGLEENDDESPALYQSWVLTRSARIFVGRYTTANGAWTGLKRYASSIADEYGGRHRYVRTATGLRGFHEDRYGRKYITEHPGGFDIDEIHQHILREVVGPAERIVAKGVERLRLGL